ncbi:tRNA(Met) cytidine acetate ligase [Lacrimispora sp. 210928-DFI.3.58]|uniref:tRNA(Met) cytidine acetate ligase n=1 Tax=Lacrimispora sp. 210928-DFI.3.58 TaxID=2883214 RepID=UPI0015B70F22|nr:nucleotidyltransferase family protein [Lacrimispora sp. 210928-DFI.3.58]MCB7320669.1 nucleotidyltransferase family protein [Lacrimispora sp. 210928-DFI.3.58]
MKVAGIVAEYNPFHSGHQYHLEETRRITGADYCVAVMSGDFVQRGEPAFFSKYLRTRMALSCGADLVLEIPSIFAVSSAEDFAACAVALLAGLGVVDVLSFGSENGDIKPIRAAASLLAQEGPNLSALLQAGLREGLTWPQARSQALLSLAESEEDFPLAKKELDQILASPNSLLGIEYCKALKRRHCSIQPVTVPRKGQGYHDLELDEGQASASALRRAFADKTMDNGHLSHVPPEIRALYMEGKPLFAGDCSGILNYRLLALFQEGCAFDDYADVSGDLASRLRHHLLQFADWEGRTRQLKTRQYTYTRISRALTHLLLGITKEQTAQAREAGYAPYGRVLGFRREAGPLMAAIKKQSSIPLVVKTAAADRMLEGTALAMFRQDLHASHVRQVLEREKYGCVGKNEYNQEICIL